MTNFEELKKRSNEIREERKKIAASLKGSVFRNTSEYHNFFSITVNLSGGLNSISFDNKNGMVFSHISPSESSYEEFILKIIDGEVQEKK